ncbi:MAG: nicotinate-nucleotide adenylyltransferase [Alphaproteobacteria bacterium]|jgi:nicotinate-nucleotide adenylyltransferase|nr:nicotinate-nucleotide adenylyltransferase [Alphaproteobacteria bacterium]
MARIRVGLLGGSFNPAHAGHRHLSVEALKRLRLDQVWWLVAPQNPLKPAAGMAPLEKRLAHAREAGRHPKIRISDIERRLGTRYTVDTLVRLGQRFPEIDFVWLMGADNLVQFPDWYRWTRIADAIPIAVFDRPTYVYRALAGRAARRFGRYRVMDPAALPGRKPPAWCLVRGPTHPASATAVRESGGWPA